MSQGTLENLVTCLLVRRWIRLLGLETAFVMSADERWMGVAFVEQCQGPLSRSTASELLTPHDVHEGPQRDTVYGGFRVVRTWKMRRKHDREHRVLLTTRQDAPRSSSFQTLVLTARRVHDSMNQTEKTSTVEDRPLFPNDLRLSSCPATSSFRLDQASEEPEREHRAMSLLQPA